MELSLRDARDRACRRAPLPGRAAQRGRKNRHGALPEGRKPRLYARNGTLRPQRRMERAHGIRGCSEPPRMGIAGRRGIVEALQGRQGNAAGQLRADRGAPAGLPAHRGTGECPRSIRVQHRRTHLETSGEPARRCRRPAAMGSRSTPGIVLPGAARQALCGSTAESRPELSDKKSRPELFGAAFSSGTAPVN